EAARGDQDWQGPGVGPSPHSEPIRPFGLVKVLDRDHDSVTHLREINTGDKLAQAGSQAPPTIVHGSYLDFKVFRREIAERQSSEANECAASASARSHCRG